MRLIGKTLLVGITVLATSLVSASEATDEPYDRFKFENKTQTVIDRSRSIEWEKYARGRHLFVDKADTYCKTLDIDGKKDWRLPSISELKSIADPSLANDKRRPVLDRELFPYPGNGGYWSNEVDRGGIIAKGFWAVTYSGNFQKQWIRNWVLNYRGMYVKCVRDLALKGSVE